MLFHKKKKYEVNIDTANTILQNVLAAESKAPNTIPFDTLVLREDADTRFYDRILPLIAAILLLTFLSPLLVVPLAERLSADSPETTAIISDYIQDERLYIQIEGFHIFFEDAWLETADGEIYSIISFDENKGLLCFPYIPGCESNIYIPVEDNLPLHLRLTPQ